MSAIEWTEETWNPIIGCSKIAQGCKNCYAEVMATRIAGMSSPLGDIYRRIIRDGRWNGRTLFLPQRLHIPIKRKKPTTFFVNSMSDLFHPDVSYGEIAVIVHAMQRAHWHRFQVLTKRPERALDWFRWHTGEIPKNVILGMSASTKEDLCAGIGDLKECPIPTWLSLEPLIGPIPEIDLSGISWVVVGGESGRKARPCETAWIADIVEQCRGSRIPVFVKQLGSHAIHEGRRLTLSGKGERMDEWPAYLRVRERQER